APSAPRARPVPVRRRRADSARIRYNVNPFGTACAHRFGDGRPPMTPFDIFPPVTRLTMLVVAAGIGLRLIGIRLRGSRYPLVRWPGWTASSLTAWMAASMFGAWSPAWIALLGGVAALVRPEWVRRHPGFVSVVDAAILLLGFGLSVGGRST